MNFVRSISLVLLILTGCVKGISRDPNTSCIQQAETACDGDQECKSIIMDDCKEAPTCDAPPGQHC
jgi:hypothetical protein